MAIHLEHILVQYLSDLGPDQMKSGPFRHLATLH